MNGFPVYRTSHVIVVHTGGSSSIVAGVIGGVVVLIGVVLTEALVRSRERRRRLEEAAWSLQTVAHGGGLLTGNVSHMSMAELSARYAALVDQLGRIRADAKWPIRNAQQIVAEVDAITIRLMVAVAKWGAEKAGPPRLGPILGERLAGLVFGTRESARQQLDEALSAEGLPSLDEVTADQAENAPPGP